MVAVKAKFDGQKIVLPQRLEGMPPADVIIVYDPQTEPDDHEMWLKAQEQALAKVWDNEEDAIYDQL